MPIFHATIIKNRKKRIVEYYTHMHNLFGFMNYLLKKIANNKKKSYKYQEKFYYHMISEQKYIFCCISTIDFPLERAFLFLQGEELASAVQEHSDHSIYYMYIYIYIYDCVYFVAFRGSVDQNHHGTFLGFDGNT